MFKKLLLILLSAAILLFSSCSLYNNKNNKPPGGSPGKPAPEEKDEREPDAVPPPEIDPIKEQIDRMTLDEKIGQLVISGVEGYTLGDNTRELIESYKVGGFIILGENVKDTQQLLGLINDIKAANSKNSIPLFISVDEEGGRVSRLPQEFKKLPASGKVGKINNSQFSYNLGSIISDELKAFGFNMDFAPVMDINSNPKNTVIGDRSFGSNADIVTELGIQTMKGLQSGSIASVIKHFPGHGDTSVDSHVGLPVVSKDLERLQEMELIPFSKAAESADAVMVAHILLTKIDAENPSSMSKAVITDILRKDLKFDGVVITDDMTMGAIVKNYDIGAAAVKSFNAGCDIILVCHQYQDEVGVLDSLKKAALDGTISSQRIYESLYRILKLKQKYKMNDNPAGPVDVEGLNKSITQLLNQ